MKKMKKRPFLLNWHAWMLITIFSRNHANIFFEYYLTIFYRSQKRRGSTFVLHAEGPEVEPNCGILILFLHISEHFRDKQTDRGSSLFLKKGILQWLSAVMGGPRVLTFQ